MSHSFNGSEFVVSASVMTGKGEGQGRACGCVGSCESERFKWRHISQNIHDVWPGHHPLRHSPSLSLLHRGHAKILIQYFVGRFLACPVESNCTHSASVVSTGHAPDHASVVLTQATIERGGIARLQLKSIFYFDRRALITKAVHATKPRPHVPPTPLYVYVC